MCQKVERHGTVRNAVMSIRGNLTDGDAQSVVGPMMDIAKLHLGLGPKPGPKGVL